MNAFTSQLMDTTYWWCVTFSHAGQPIDSHENAFISTSRLYVICAYNVINNMILFFHLMLSLPRTNWCILTLNSTSSIDKLNIFSVCHTQSSESIPENLSLSGLFCWFLLRVTIYFMLIFTLKFIDYNMSNASIHLSEFPHSNRQGWHSV